MPLQPNFHGIGRRGWCGRMHHSHRHSRQQMKQRPQNVHKRHGCVTSTKHFAFRNSEACISVRLSSKQCHDMLDFKTKMNDTKLNGTMVPVVFFVHCSCISMQRSHIFFSCHKSHRSTASSTNTDIVTMQFSRSHRHFYTQKLLHTDGFTHRRFYTQTLLHADAFYTRTHAFTHKRVYTQTHWHTDAFTHRRFYTQMLFTHARMLSHTNAFTHRRFYTQTLLHKRNRPSQFFLSFWRPTFISCVRVARDTSKSQFFLSF